MFAPIHWLDGRSDGNDQVMWFGEISDYVFEVVISGTAVVLLR